MNDIDETLDLDVDELLAEEALGDWESEKLDQSRRQTEYEKVINGTHNYSMV